MHQQQYKQCQFISQLLGKTITPLNNNYQKYIYFFFKWLQHIAKGVIGQDFSRC